MINNAFYIVVQYIKLSALVIVIKLLIKFDTGEFKALKLLFQ